MTAEEAAIVVAARVGEEDTAMAIDGVIGFVSRGYDTEREDGTGLPTCDLFIVERPEPGGSYRGQATLRILAPTWEPEIGMAIWGGASDVEIVTRDGPRRYWRVGYTWLREQEASDA